MTTAEPRPLTLRQWLVEKGTRYYLDHGLLSPSGHVSKRARDAALKREDAKRQLELDSIEEYRKAIDAGEVTDPSGGYTPRPDPELVKRQRQAESLRRHAKLLRGFAENGFRPRAHAKEADRAEAEADLLWPQES